MPISFLSTVGRIFQYSLSFEDFLFTFHTPCNECSNVCWKQKNEICVNYNYLVFSYKYKTMLSNYHVKCIH